MTSKTILVTRPQGDEVQITDMLHAHGYRVIHEPLTHIFLQHTQRQALEHALHGEPDAVIVTSRHAVYALSLLSDLRDAYLICVGESTAQVALSVGFTRVTSASGNARGIVEMVSDAYDPGSRFLYLSGEHVRVDLESELTALGMQVERISLYEAMASEHLSDILVELLKRRQLDAVTFLSQRTAQIFMHLLAQAGIQDCTHNLIGFCLSKTVSEPLSTADWKGMHIARHATLASLVQSVDNVFQHKGMP